MSWIVEMHVHTHYSQDSLVSPENMIKTCRAKGIDKIIVTDHNSITGGMHVWAIAPDLTIIGEEIMTSEGEILAFFVQEWVPPYLTPLETIRRLRDQGAFISVAHPFDRLRKGAWRREPLLEIIEQVDALEVFNARCIFPSDNAAALDLAQRHHKLKTVGSDAHTCRELGRATVEMTPFDSVESFRASLALAKFHTRLSSPFIHLSSTYAKWARKLGLRPMPVS